MFAYIDGGFDGLVFSDIMVSMEGKKIKLDWLSIGEAAEYLGVSRDTLRRWEKRGKLKSYRTPGGRRRYTAYDLELALKPPKTVPHLIPQKKGEAPKEEAPGKAEEEKEVSKEKPEEPSAGTEKEAEEGKKISKEEPTEREGVEKPATEEKSLEGPLRELLKKREEQQKEAETADPRRPYLIKVVSLGLLLLVLSAIVLPATVNLVIKATSDPGEPFKPLLIEQKAEEAQSE